ncbi:MAG: class I SAM-dependent methyltransferase [Solirubrobacteraceae bacterium]
MHTLTSSERLIDWQVAVLRELGRELPPGATYLDFGCGAGKDVDAARTAGFDAFGCDIVLDLETERLRRIEAPYRIPFSTATFDFVGSNTVFEHVQNPAEAFGEIHRVLKPGGTSVHMFPSRWSLREPHTYVPLASVIQSWPWLKMWAMLGVRNEFQSGMSSPEVAGLNHAYLRDHTRYLTRRQIRSEAQSAFARVVFAEGAAITTSRGRLGLLAPVVRRAPLVARAYSGLRARVVFLENA